MARDLASRFGDIQDFFDQDALVIDLSRLESGAVEGEHGTVDFPALLELLKKYRLAPVAVHGERAEQAAAALAAGEPRCAGGEDRAAGGSVTTRSVTLVLSTPSMR